VLDFSIVKRIGVLFHPKIKRSEEFARSLHEYLTNHGTECLLHSSWDESGARLPLKDSDLVVSIGGDGTMLRAARIVFPHEIPIIGVNFGNLGFMTELEAANAVDGLLAVISGEGWVENRVMLEAHVKSSGKSYHALNDVVVGRGRNLRLIGVDVQLDEEMLTTYRADAVILATATGSTGYALAADGPILYPESRDILLKAVCPHLSLDKALVVASGCKIKLKVHTNHEAVISMDGQVEEQLSNEDEITVMLSKNVSRFMRLRPRGTFYTTLVSKLKGKSI
jgi:NAD+ kinase